MSDILNITNVTMDKLTAKVGSKVYGVTGCTLRLLINTPGSCELVLAQGQSIRQGQSKNSTSNRLSSTDIDAFTQVVVSLYSQGNKAPIILFRGFVSSVSNIAAKNASGSYAGIVINATAPPALMTGYGLNGYRYWGSKADSKGRAAVTTDQEQVQLLNKLGKGYFSTTFNGNTADFFAADDFAAYIVRTAGILTESVSKQRYSEASVTGNFEYRGRKLLESSGLSSINVTTDRTLTNYVEEKLKRSNPLAAIQSVFQGQMFLNLVPMPCGKFDVIPEFPWAAETVATIRRKDILSLRDSTAMSSTSENIDSVMVPLLFNNISINNYVEWPRDDLPAAGVSRVVNIPEWLSPFANSVEATPKQTTSESTLTKTNKGGKDKKGKIDDKNDRYREVAGILAQSFFAQIKNSGVTLEVSVQWHRLEFLDALGYLMEIEQPIIGTDTSKENLYGFLAGAAFKVQSTPGGSQVNLVLSFTHVRSKALHDKYALKSNPLYQADGGPETALRAFFAKPGREYTRAQQTSLEGGAHDEYLDQAESEARNKK